MALKTKLDQASIERKIIIIGTALIFSVIAVRACYLITRGPIQKRDTAQSEPDYKAYLQEALEKYEEAQSAFIYKDTEKTRKLLRESRKQAQRITPQNELYAEAQRLIKDIEEKDKQARELEKEKEKD
ncbi:MAG: hypothetical protein ABIC19_01425 [Patescibacteria group bacterium]|nr:hypothetical protein [Patescibacteria group bacterium]